jgi:hypothetical protein
MRVLDLSIVGVEARTGQRVVQLSPRDLRYAGSTVARRKPGGFRTGGAGTVRRSDPHQRQLLRSGLLLVVLGAVVGMLEYVLLRGDLRRPIVPRSGAWPQREQPVGRSGGAEEESDQAGADPSSSDSVETAPISPDQAVS